MLEAISLLYSGNWKE